MPELRQYLISVNLALLELICWFLFWAWVRSQVGKALENDIETVKQAGEQTGFINFLKYYFLIRFHKYADSESPTVKAILHGSKLFVFLITALVPTGARVTATAICGIFGANKTFVYVCLGDIVHTLVFFYGWKVLFSFF